ncbi:MAG: MOSC N-terminal beta barrel domain-containing protein [Pseudomonadota bacterium]
MSSSTRIQSLHVYPVKSCAGIEMPAVQMVATGFAHDREWMIATPAGHFLTQRDAPAMALIATRVEGGNLQLATPAGEGPVVPLDHEGPRCEVTVWRSRCAAFDAGAAMAEFLSGWLGRAVRLVRFDPAGERLSNQDWTGEIRAPNLFSDGYPLLVLSVASVADLNRRVGRELPMNRFRPNIVIDGVRAYAEDSASELTLGDVTLRLSKPCLRCVITTTDQASGERDGEEPMHTLKTYRFDRELRGVTFGRNALILRGQGATLSAGQPAVLG